MLFRPVFGFINWMMINVNQFMIIICLIFVSPKCVGYVFDGFPLGEQQCKEILVKVSLHK